MQEGIFVFVTSCQYVLFSDTYILGMGAACESVDVGDLEVASAATAEAGSSDQQPGGPDDSSGGQQQPRVSAQSDAASTDVELQAPGAKSLLALLVVDAFVSSVLASCSSPFLPQLLERARPRSAPRGQPLSSGGLRCAQRACPGRVLPPAT